MSQLSIIPIFRLKPLRWMPVLSRKAGARLLGWLSFRMGVLAKRKKAWKPRLCALIDVGKNASLCLTVDQTEPNSVNQVEGHPKKTRVGFYAEQLEKVAVTILQYTKIGVFDGFYAKQKFVDKTIDWGFGMISRLRQDANLKHLYNGEQKPKGRPRKFAEKG